MNRREKLTPFEMHLAALTPAHVSRAEWLAMSEAERLAAIKAAASAPDACGPDVPVAPGRGAFRIIRTMSVVPGSAGAGQRAGYLGRDTTVTADVWDKMADEARRRSQPQPFGPGQIAIGRRYRTLVEMHSAGGLRSASLEAGRGGGGGAGGGFSEAHLRVGDEIRALRRRLGSGAALALRRVRPSKRGAAGQPRRTITDRALVDAVALGDASLSAVLKAHGWACEGACRDALRSALAEALDRMQGYRGG